MLFIPAAAFSQFAGGDGSSGNPYQVSTAAELNNVRNYLTSYFIQTADIQLGESPWNQGEGWNPIGTNSTSFQGNYNGGNYKILNLTINRGLTNYVGIFGYCSSATLQNIVIQSPNITAYTAIGPLVGYALNSYISNCAVIGGGSISGENYVGGLAGWIVGSNIYSSYTYINVFGFERIGGMVGRCDTNSNIANSYSRSYVSASNDYAGGFAGYCLQTTVANSYSSGYVDCVGSVKGGFIAYNTVTANITECYWDTEASGQTSSPGGGTGKTTAEMKSQTTFSAWDFSTPVWKIYSSVNDGYPYLAWGDWPGILTTIASPSEGGSVTTGGAYEEGTPVWLEASPTAPYYQFKNWTDNTSAVISTDPNFVYYMPEGDMTLTAKFEKYFSEVSAGFRDVAESTTSWCDYDNDGDLDVLVVGWNGASSKVAERVAKIYRNDGGEVFTDINAGLIPVRYSSCAWGDYDNDGLLDLVVSGWESSLVSTRIYKNYGSDQFYDVGAGLPGINSGSVAWSDYDNDGDLDLTLSGWCPSQGHNITNIYKNTNGSFTDISAGLTGLQYSSIAWADYDNDGDPDLLTTGLTDGSTTLTVLYNNNNGIFTDAGIGLHNLHNGSVAWGDYDNDGDPDILLTGQETGGKQYTEIYRNDLTGFTDIDAATDYASWSSAAWCDIDNDGILDIIVTGKNPDEIKIAKVYNIFSDTVYEKTNIAFEGVHWGSIGCGDYDNDGDSDIIISGYDSIEHAVTKLYRNNHHPVNTPPSAPANLAWTLFDNDVTLSWDRSTDSQTYDMGLTYNIYVGSSPANGNTKSSMSDNSTGFRKVVQLGNAGQLNSYTIKDLPLGTYYWSVQAIDPSYKGSLFATEGTFVVSSFTEMTTSLPGLGNSYNSWGDYDNDGDLDVIVSGTTGTARLTEIFRNDGGGTFTDIDAGIVNVWYSASAWGDYDNDGDLDLVISGHTGSVRTANIYMNDSGVFTDIGAGLPGVNAGSLAWGDYDNDGDLDLLLTGYNGTSAISALYRNDSGVFTDTSAGITGVYKSSGSWADYDNDGDLDILITGLVTGVTRVAKIYRNDYGYFFEISAGLTGVQDGTSAWGDFDNDGDQDILMTGNGIAKIYHNNGFDNFSEWDAGFTGVNFSSAAWGDYDSDGDLDAIISGLAGSEKTVKIYRNEGWGFTDIGAGLQGIQDGSVTWADYDNDNDLDVFYTGTAGTTKTSKLYRNNAVIKNTTPSDPVNLSSVVHTDGSVTFSWDRASDNETPQYGLSYNLYISSTSMGLDQMTPMSDLTNGYRRIVNTGNMCQATSWTIKDLPTGHFYWSVQAVDHNFAGSNFSGEQEYSSFTNINAGLEGIHIGDGDWGDFDNDGDLDILLTGYESSYGPFAAVYRNNIGTKMSEFSNISAALEGVYESASEWADYDNDGDLDIALCGYSYTYGYTTRIYRNDSGVFTDINAPLQGVQDGSLNWGDYDNDGDLDLLLTGHNGSYYVSKVYRNDSGTFSDISAPLEGVYNGSAEWGDYDNDGDLDIVLCGYNGSYTISKIYRNDSGSFTDISAQIIDAYYGSIDWGDYDNDGDLDILLSGYSYTSGIITKIYRNDSGTFTDINAALAVVHAGSAYWGDYDNDGDLDIALTGHNGYGGTSKIYRNDNGIFTDTNAPIMSLYWSDLSWGDYNNDGALDLLLCGYNDYDGSYYSIVYENNSIITNPVVSAPADLVISGKLNDAVFSFTPPATKSPAESYTYNMDISIAGINVKTSMADITTGQRKVAEIGNLNFGNSDFKKGPVASSWNLLKNMPNTILPQEVLLVEAAVQSVDHSYTGSAFTFAFEHLPNRDLKTLPKEVMVRTDELLWELFWSDSLQSYTLQMDEDPLFNSPFEETQYLVKNDPKIIYVAVELQDLSFFSSMTDNTTYYWRVRPNHVNHSKETVFNSAPDSFIYNPVLSAPLNVAVASIDGNSVVLTWDPVPLPNVEYSVYSANMPYAVFPAEWTLEASKLGNTTCTVNSGGAAMKFFIVTATDGMKSVTIKKISERK